jgi:hypothetical protein
LDATIIDSPDGSFGIKPKPERVRTFRLIFAAGGASVILIGVGFLVASVMSPESQVLFRLIGIFALVMGVAEAVFVSRLVIPDGIAADANEVCYQALVGSRRLARSDLSFILRAKTWAASRYGGGDWAPSYVFVRRDGGAAISCSAAWFAEESISEFAGRLQVPLRGDFSVQVKDRVEPAS